MTGRLGGVDQEWNPFFGRNPSNGFDRLERAQFFEWQIEDWLELSPSGKAVPASPEVP